MGETRGARVSSDFADARRRGSGYDVQPQRSVVIYPEKLQSNAAKYIKYVTDGTCWICISHPLSHGIPYIKRNGGQSMPVAAYVYEREVGPLRDGLFLTRSCGNLKCICPDHARPKPFPDARKVKGDARERIARLSDILTVREAARISGLSERTVIRIRAEYGYTNRAKKTPVDGRYTSQKLTKL